MENRTTATKICVPASSAVWTIGDEATCDVTYICYETDPVLEDLLKEL